MITAAIFGISALTHQPMLSTRPAAAKNTSNNVIYVTTFEEKYCGWSMGFTAKGGQIEARIPCPKMPTPKRWK